MNDESSESSAGIKNVLMLGVMVTVVVTLIAIPIRCMMGSRVLCPECESARVVDIPYGRGNDIRGWRYVCGYCDHTWTVPPTRKRKSEMAQ